MTAKCEIVPSATMDRLSFGAQSVRGQQIASVTTVTSHYSLWAVLSHAIALLSNVLISGLGQHHGTRPLTAKEKPALYVFPIC